MQPNHLTLQSSEWDSSTCSLEKILCYTALKPERTQLKVQKGEILCVEEASLCVCQLHSSVSSGVGRLFYSKISVFVCLSANSLSCHYGANHHPRTPVDIVVAVVVVVFYYQTVRLPANQKGAIKSIPFHGATDCQDLRVKTHCLFSVFSVCLSVCW